MSCNRDLDFFPVISFSYKSKKLKLLNKIGHYQLPDSFSFGLEVTRWPLHPKAWSSSHGIFGRFHCCWKCCLLFSWILLSFSAQLVSAKSFVTLLIHYSFVLLSFFHCCIASGAELRFTSVSGFMNQVDNLEHSANLCVSFCIAICCKIANSDLRLQMGPRKLDDKQIKRMLQKRN